MCSGYPLMTPTSLHTLVASCLMGHLSEALWGLEASLQEIHKWRRGCNQSSDTDIHVKSPVTNGI